MRPACCSRHFTARVWPVSPLGALAQPQGGPDNPCMRLRLTAVAIALLALSGLGLGASTASGVTLGQAGGLKYVRTTTPLPLASFDELKARCGGSWHAFGGGASVSGPTISGQLESTTPFDGNDGNAQPDDGWLGAASNLGSVPLTVKTYAICSHTNPDYGQITSQTFAIDSMSGAGIVCDAPPFAVGGGIRSFTASGNTHLVYTEPDPGLAEWEGGVYVDAGPADAEFRVHAICVAGVDVSLESADEEIESGPASVTVNASCPAGTHVTGGGVSIETNVPNAEHSWINASRPLDDADPGHLPDDGWAARAQLSAGADGATAYAICAES